MCSLCEKRGAGNEEEKRKRYTINKSDDSKNVWETDARFANNEEIDVKGLCEDSKKKERKRF